MLFCLKCSIPPQSHYRLVRDSYATCSPTALSSSKDLPRCRSSQLCLGQTGAWRRGSALISACIGDTTSEATPRSGTAPWNGPQGTAGGSSQPARRVALPSSPTETLRLCEPCGMPTPKVPGVVSSVTMLPLRAQAPTGQGRDTMSRRFCVVPSSGLICFGAIRRMESSRPHGVGSLLECLS